MGVFLEQISGLLARLLPSGGTAGQVLLKASGADYDTAWVTPGQAYTYDPAAVELTEAAGTNVTIVSVAIGANEVMEFTWWGWAEQTNNAGIQFTITLPSGGGFRGVLQMPNAATTSANTNMIASGTAYGTNSWPTTNQAFFVKIEALISNGATAGNVVLAFKRNGTGTAKIKPNRVAKTKILS